MFQRLPYRTLLLALLMLALNAHAQEQLRLRVLDELDDRPIANVLVADGERTLAITDETGVALVPTPPPGGQKLSFAHLSFRDTTVRFAFGARSGTVRLQQRSHLIGAVDVTRPLPETVFLRKDLHSADLLINEHGMWVLAYERPRMLRAEGDAGKEILRDTRLVLLDTLLREKASCLVPEDVFGLRHDLHDRVVIEGTAHAFSVDIGTDAEGDTRLLLRPFGLEELRKAILPWTDTIPGWVLGSNASPVYPAFDHLAYDPVQDSGIVFCSVVDTFMMQLFRSQYKYLKNSEKVVAMNLAQELGVDKEVAAGYMSGFHHNIWYKPVYAPLFVVGDTLLVLDHARGRMRKFDRSLKAQREVPLSYLRKGAGRDRTERILQDRATQKLYAVFARNGRTWLCEVDPSTGNMGSPIKVTYHYPDRLQVHDGALYYIHRPNESLQKRAIYRERIR